MGDKDSEQNALVDILTNPSVEAKELPFSLLEDITAKFSTEHEIGRGTFGVVYKGELRNGMKVAVKRLKHFGWISDYKQFYAEFYAEVDCLKKLKNKNIVRLLGYCVHVGMVELMMHGEKVPAETNRERLLCFEFVPHGTVQKAGAFHGAEWPKRYQIIKGICDGLEYIHNAKYLHLDLKPDNILLGENMEPKITDFGVSRFFGDQSTHDTMRSPGTRGYMAPEYINKGTVSEKTDIYSLGVVIFELVTGSKGPDVHESTQKQKDIFLEQALLDWNRSLSNSHRGPSLELAYRQVETCIKIALNCTDLNRGLRRPIKEIARILDCNIKRPGDHVQQNCNLRASSDQSEIRTCRMTFENRCCNDNYLMREVSEKIQEGISESFAVKDPWVYSRKKDPYPFLSDQVYRLKKMVVNGDMSKLQEQMGIEMVQAFLWSYNKDKNSLRKDCGTIPDHDWDIIVGYALSCKLPHRQYSYYIQERDATILFNSLYSIIGATFSGRYTSYEKFNKAQKDLVESYRTTAYYNFD